MVHGPFPAPGCILPICALDGIFSRMPPCYSWNSRVAAAVRCISMQNSQSLPPSNSQLHRGDLLILRGELQHSSAQMEAPHAHPAPLTWSNSRKGETPVPFQEFSSRTSAMSRGEPNYNWYQSTSLSSSCSFTVRGNVPKPRSPPLPATQHSMHPS